MTQDINIFEKALITPIFESLAELSLLKAKSRKSNKGIVFSYIKKEDRSLTIGFNADKNIELGSKESISENLLKNRIGSKREERLIKMTLNELGFYPIDGKDCYHHSKQLERTLKILGWPI